MIVLGIETTCDETAAAIVKNGHEILSNIVFSQVDIHKKYGGVFPEMASRCHMDKIIPVIDTAIKKANIKKEDIDLISVANGPGLIGPLFIGLSVAKGLSISLKKPFIGINHIEAHLYASMMNDIKNLLFPSIGVVISGGHTMIVKILDVGKYKIIGTTIDDAIGEAFDKTATILGLEYPGGPNIEKLAIKGDSSIYKFKKGKTQKDFDFSFSGIKTKVLYTVKGQSSNKKDPTIIKEEDKAHIAASFQETVFQDLIEKTLKALNENKCKAIYLGGGVSNNQRLRKMFEEKNIEAPIFWPKKGLSLDNAAMIAGLGYQKFIKRPLSDPLSLGVFTRSASF